MLDMLMDEVLRECLGIDVDANATVLDGLSRNVIELCNSTSRLVVNVNKLTLLETNFLLALVYLCIVAVALVLGVFGNVAILIVAWTRRAIARSGREFVINLAVADFCVAIVADPICIIGVIKGERWFDDKFWFCQFVAAMCLTACICSFMSLLMATLARYVYLCHNVLYDKFYNRCFAISLCIACWLVAFFCEFPNFVGWGGHYFDQKNHQCIWDRTASLSYTLFVSFVLIGGPLLIMTVCYVIILRRIWFTKVNVYKYNTEDPLWKRQAWQETVRSSQTLFCTFVVFVICWTPYAIVVAVDVKDSFSTEVHLFITLLAHIHSSCNGIIYFTLNRSFRQAVLNAVCCPWTASEFTATSDTNNRTALANHTSSDTPMSQSDPPTPQASTISNMLAQFNYSYMQGQKNPEYFK